MNLAPTVKSNRSTCSFGACRRSSLLAWRRTPVFSLTVNIVSEFFDRHFFWRTPSPLYRNRFKCWFRFFMSLENEICALNAACVFLISQEWYYYQRIFQRSDIGSYEARLREKLNLQTSRVGEKCNFTRTRFTEFSSREVVRGQLNSRENKFSSSSLTICIENAIELEANSISQIFISAQTNIAELNFY